MKTLKELWADNCLENGVEVFHLERDEETDTDLFSIKVRATDEMERKGYAYERVSYAVWVDSRRWKVSPSYTEAYALYMNERKRQ